MTGPHRIGTPVDIRFFLDSADFAAAEPWLRTGLFAGVTTNPRILHAAGRRLSDIAAIADWAGAGGREVCFQVWGDTADELYRAAREIRRAAPDATVKVPCTAVGAEVVRRLHTDGVPVLLTAVYSGKQALIASALGVRYLAPYFNRMNLAGRDALAEIAHMTSAIPQDGRGPLVMAASLKTAEQVVALSDIGVRVFTISPAVAADLFADDLTAEAVAAFEATMPDVR